MSGEGRGDVWVQREHPAQDKPQGCSRRQRDGNGGKVSSRCQVSVELWEAFLDSQEPVNHSVKHRCSRRQRDGNSGQFSSQISSPSFGWVVRRIFSCDGILSTCQSLSFMWALTCYLHRNPIYPAHLKHHGATSVFDVLLAQDSPHQEPRALSKQMRSIDEKEKNFELLEADLGTGPGPVSSISGPKVIQFKTLPLLVFAFKHLRSSLKV